MRIPVDGVERGGDGADGCDGRAERGERGDGHVRHGAAVGGVPAGAQISILYGIYVGNGKR